MTIRKLGSNLKVTALIDPTPEHRAHVLQEKRSSPVAPCYEVTKEYNDVDAWLSDLTEHTTPDVVREHLISNAFRWR